MEENRIEKHIDLKASPARVWKALTDHKEFGQWFGVKLEGPFVVGETVCGKLTYPGFEHLQWAVDVKQMEPERLFSFTWHPYPVDVTIDYSKETPTLVEFTLEAAGSGTHLVVTESGFEKIPANRRLEAFRMNQEGWVEQLENIAKHVG
ncbi:MAG: SRPBCC family protein [Anaerolineales bacterium]|nr:SRPBCC family protein [Anaerolineales bacterium]